MKSVEDMTLREMLLYIRSRLERRTLLEALAEEAAELSAASAALSKAALKCIRAENLSNNPTPVNKAFAWSDLEKANREIVEEHYDILACELVVYEDSDPDTYESNHANDPAIKKIRRWVRRLQDREVGKHGES
ncbi:hypothetical protein [Acidaminococcus sp.]|uniref:hypothetical protein n=1 Tax=Acidaminococcus sp. TaxID=1872103 RepID=UPI003D7C8B2A